jgi:hypothetical protein
VAVLLWGGHFYGRPKVKNGGLEGRFLQFVEVEKEMSDRQAWATRFSYFCGTDRNTFRVDLNQQGKRVNSTAMVGPPSRRIRNPSAPGRIRRITGRIPPSSLISPIHRA